MPLAAAQRGVEEHTDFLLHCNRPTIQQCAKNAPVLCENAWEEHILWTQRYASDCHRLLGYFLDHIPGAASNVESSITFEAA